MYVLLFLLCLHSHLSSWVTKPIIEVKINSSNSTVFKDFHSCCCFSWARFFRKSVLGNFSHIIFVWSVESRRNFHE